MSPHHQYSERLGQREHRLANDGRLNHRIETLRLLLAVLVLAIGFWCARQGYSALWIAVPGVLFVGALAYHRRIRMALTRAERSAAFYRAGLARMEGRREASGIGAGRSSNARERGESFRNEHHVYGADLDLFGEHSLYERLCAARTPMGRATLAAWLLTAADVGTILERQACVAELRDRLDLREDLAILGEPQYIELETAIITGWTDARDELAFAWLPVTASGLAVLAVAAAVVWAVFGIAFPFLAVLVAEAALNYFLRDRVQRCVAGVEHAYEDLKLLSGLMARIESETFELPALCELAGKLSTHSLRASVALAKLSTTVNFVEARRNPFLTPLMLPLLYTIHSALAAERWRRRHGRAVAAWLDVLGEFEALASIAGYSFERPDDPFPRFVEGRASFAATGLGHPLIGSTACVRNDVDLSGETRVLLVSGSNMSGKSTLLRSVGINTVLAMAGAPVCATHLELTPLQVGASIRVHDSLFEGSSRFFAEITRLKQLFDPSDLPLLFLLDELLQGTNSNDRRIGAHGVVRALIGRGAIGLVSTHDLALTDGPDYARGELRNVHFQDEFAAGKLTFDFRLREGVVTKSNGIELMRAIGLDV